MNDTRVYSRIFWNSQVLASSFILVFSLAVVYTPQDRLPQGLAATAQVACEARVKWKSQALGGLAVRWGPPLAGPMGWKSEVASKDGTWLPYQGLPGSKVG